MSLYCGKMSVLIDDKMLFTANACGVPQGSTIDPILFSVFYVFPRIFYSSEYFIFLFTFIYYFLILRYVSL